MKKDIIGLFKAARRVSTPFLAIETPDQRDLAGRLVQAVGNGDNPVPKMTFDLARGVMPVNETGKQFLDQYGDEKFAGNPAGALVEIGPRLPRGGVIIMFNAQLFLDDGMVIQAVCNLRDEYKSSRRTLVFLGPSFKLKSELSDVVMLDEPRPDDEQLGEILTKLYKSAFEREPEPEIAKDGVSAVRGLAAFEADQALAMSLTKDGLDVEDAGERTKAVVNKTEGLKYIRGGPTFADMGGVHRWKELMTRIHNGPEDFDLILFMDEIEKSMAGATSDHTGDSGVSKRIHGTLLTWMEDNGHDGIIAVGLPGTGKSYAGKAIGGEFGKPTIVLDIGGLMGSLVGETERHLREALKVIDSIAGHGKVFAFATCNGEAALAPEFKRRFHSGRWYFDLPDEEEKAVIWEIHKKKIGIEDDVHPVDTNWTGAEIRNCVVKAHKLQCSLVEAGEFVIPIAKSDPKSVETIRRAADGNWFSASYPGPYKKDKAEKLERDIQF